jgi:glyoxylase-like metal-dependent hydrolase (beta-lactamase superfamily II)
MAEVKTFFHEETSTLTHVVFDKISGDAVIIDPVMDFNLRTFSIAETSVKQVLNFCKESKLRVSHVLETHMHADHLSGSQLVKKILPEVKICIGQEVTLVQKHFAEIYDLGSSFVPDGSQFDFLYKNGGEVDLGSFAVKTWHTPGHTPACYTLQIEDKLFTGDALFAPDVGTGRCDFPGGDAKTLFQSIKTKIYSQADVCEVYFAHDYPHQRALLEHVALDVEKKSNIRLSSKTREEDFIKFRGQRDKELAPPRLILPSLLVNMLAGKLPEKRKNGRRYLSIPMNVF